MRHQPSWKMITAMLGSRKRVLSGKNVVGIEASKARAEYYILET